MLTYRGGHKVGRGTYWDLRSGHRTDIADEGVLPGNAASTYLKMSSGVMVLLGPIIGLIYVISLPFIGIVTVATLAGGKLIGGMYRLVGRSISFGWRPRTAYLAGKKKGKKDADASS
jgi:hypothetical protein